MNKKEYSVVIDDTFYKGKDLYSDGEVEDHILEICKDGKIDEALKSNSSWPILYHLSDIRKNLLDWYPISQQSDVLEIGSGCGAISGLLAKKAKTVTCIELSKKRSLINAYRNRECDNIRIILGNFEDIKLNQKYDYVTLIGVLEYAAMYISSKNPYIDLLSKAFSLLKENGKLIIAIENKMGLKYLNGANEDHYGKPYVGINDYISCKGIRTFSKNEIESMLRKIGEKNWKFYYPVPDYKLPYEIYSDLFLPQPGDIRYYRVNYDSPRSYMYNESVVFDQISNDGMFPYFSNSFLVICRDKEYMLRYAKYNRERKDTYRLKTTIMPPCVRKETLNKNAQVAIKNLERNYHLINKEYKNLEIVKGETREGMIDYPIIKGVKLDSTLYETRHNINDFVSLIRKYIDLYFEYNKEYEEKFIVTDSFKEVFGEIYPQESVCLKATNIDLLFHNVLLQNERAYLIDYEWVFDFPVPHNYVIWRAITQVWRKYCMYFQRECSVDGFVEKFGISDNQHYTYTCMEKNFAQYVFGKNNQECYTQRYVKNGYGIETKTLY